jgi:hypothetical protein
VGTPGDSAAYTIPHKLSVVYQDKLQPDQIAINISLYSDGTQLNSFGTKKACGVYLWINNLPRDIRLSCTKKGGAILIGYIPGVCCHLYLNCPGLIEVQITGKSSDNSSTLAQHRAQAYQTAYLEILRSAISATDRKRGFTFDNGSPSLCLAVLNILIVIMDYEEV